MRKTKEILRLRVEMGLGLREIVRSLNISHSTVKDQLSRADLAGLSWPLPEGMDDVALKNLCFPGTVAKGAVRVLSRTLPLFTRNDAARGLRWHFSGRNTSGIILMATSTASSVSCIANGAEHLTFPCARHIGPAKNCLWIGRGKRCPLSTKKLGKPARHTFLSQSSGPATTHTPKRVYRKTCLPGSTLTAGRWLFLAGFPNSLYQTTCNEKIFITSLMCSLQ